MIFVSRWLTAFILTLAIEIPIASVMLAKREPRTGRRIALIAFANLATHPLVWFVFPKLLLPYLAQLTLAEFWAFGLEAIFYTMVFNIRPARAALVSFTANAVSATLGYYLMRAIS